MKQTLLLGIFFLLFNTITFSQLSNLTFFSDQGEPFHIILNGQRYNEMAQTHVKISDLSGDAFKVKVIFKDLRLGEISKNIFLQKGGMESTFCIKQNRKGKYVIRFQGESALTSSPKPINKVATIQQSTAQQPKQTYQTTSSTIRQNHHTQDNTGGHQNNSTLQMKDSEAGININFNMGGQNVSTTSTTTTSTFTTTTTTQTGNIIINPEPQGYILPGYSGQTGCPYPTTPQDFIHISEQIRAKSFDETRLTIAKQILDAQCMLCSQVKQLMLIFDFEESRLEFAKYAYGYTYDYENFYTLNDAFSFEQSSEELNQYIIENPIIPYSSSHYSYHPYGYSGPTGCAYPVSDERFQQIKASITSKAFEETKLTIAKQVISSNCLLCSQIKEIMLMFDFENTRLDLAKYAWNNAYDQSNYYQLNDAFTFEDSIEALNRYIQN